MRDLSPTVSRLAIVVAAQICVPVVPVRAQDVPPPATSETTVVPKAEATTDQASEESSAKKVSPANNAEVPAKDESAPAANEASPANSEAASASQASAPDAPVAANDEPAPAGNEVASAADTSATSSAPVQTETGPAPEPTAPVAETVTPAQETVAQASQENAVVSPEAPTVPSSDATTVAATEPVPATPEPAAPAPEPATPAASSPETVAQAPQEAPAPVQETAAPSTDAPAVAAATPAPTEIVSAPEPTAAVAEPVAPAQETVVQAAPENPATGSAEAPATPSSDTIAVTATEPVRTETAATPEPIASAPEPAAAAPEIVAQASQEAPAPVQETVAPSTDAPAVAATAPAPAQTETVPAPEPTAPVAEPVTPAQETVAQAPQENAVVVAPEAPTVSSSDATTVAAAEPVPAAPEPATSAPELATAAISSPETVAQAPQEAPAPVQETAALSTDAPAPAQETVVPSTDTAAVAAIAASAPAETVSVSEPAAPAPTLEPAAASPEPVTPVEETVAPAPATATEAIAAIAEQTETAPAAASTLGVAIDHFEFSYGLGHPELPPLEELQGLTFKVTRVGNVYRVPGAGAVEELTLGGIPPGSRFDAEVLRNVAQEVVRWYNSRGLAGVWVAYQDLESSAASGLIDNRPADDRGAHLVVWASQIQQVRTLARGKRIKPENSIDNRKHRRIIKNSPLHGEKAGVQAGSLFKQDELNDYLYGLSLHPGRRVEASIASAGEPGKVVLDYLVNESKTWQVFGQVNNFGTEVTGKIRARVGFQHNQLTNHDDILNLDLISTTDFKTYGAFLSYRMPLWRPAKLLMRIYGSYGDFLTNPSGDVVDIRYTGKNSQYGIEFMNRATLGRNWQLQSIIGANLNHYGVQQFLETPTSTGESKQSEMSRGNSDFLVPFIGTTLTRNYGWGSVSAGLRVDHTLSGYANTDVKAADNIEKLGRNKVDSDWTSVRWNLNGLFYLEPLFQRSAQTPTLAHEVSVRLKGRTLVRGRRLIPHEQEALGGALSVRGYPESEISADEFYAATIEYAYHIPFGLKPAAEAGTLFGHPFKWRPKQAGQTPDWDLVLRGFFDYAYRGVNPPQSDEGAGTTAAPTTDEDLPYSDRSFSIAGTGVGVALMVKQNFSLRCDFGVALTELRDPFLDEDPEKQIKVPKGNKEVYLSSSYSW